MTRMNFAEWKDLKPGPLFEGMEVANTILQQLGGNKFVTMTGVRRFVGHRDGLAFALPQHFAKDNINMIIIDLDVNDTYTVKFLNPKKTVNKISDVHAADLQSVFKNNTGLDTHI